MRAEPLLIEGYASLFGLADAAGDVGGAFARSLTRPGGVAMLLQHRDGARAGRWTRVCENGRGLFVRGLVEAPGALALVAQGLDGLSIGFRPRLWSPIGEAGRELREIDKEFAARLESGVTATCLCWAIALADGFVLRLTEHDRPLGVDGETYLPGAGSRGRPSRRPPVLRRDGRRRAGRLSMMRSRRKSWRRASGMGRGAFGGR